MTTIKIWSRLLRALGVRSARPDSLLLSAEQMHEHLERERLRADRSGTRFTILNMRFANASSADRSVNELTRILRGRIRGSDLAGWLYDGSIGVLLWGSPIEGGRKLASEIEETWSPTVPGPQIEIYIYPSESYDRQSPEAGSSQPPREHVPGAETLILPPMPVWKRGLDLVGAGVGLAFGTPLFVLIAVAIKIDSPGPVLFRQQRRGRNGHAFWLYKFRSMVTDAEMRKRELIALNEQDGPAFKIGDDPRVTRMGRLLRATNVDELPQLWNVLKGEMSLVGPRPLPCDEADACEAWQRRRMDVTPGLTCFWQVKEQRNSIPFHEWIRMDLRYVKQRSAKLDMTLLARTLRLFFRRKRC